MAASGKFHVEHAGARADIQAAGSRVVFVRVTPGLYDPVTDTWTDIADTTIGGFAIEVAGQPDVYAALSLNLSTMPTLLFAPDGYPLRAHTAEFVQPGDRTTYNGRDFLAKEILPRAAPDGAVIMANVVVA